MAAELNPVEREWREFAGLVYPAGTPQLQLIECRQAFFAGGIALFNLLLTQLHQRRNAERQQ
jgi:hypothetical protein